MKPEEHIIVQLKEQLIEFELLQTRYDPSESSHVSQTRRKWTEKFIGPRTAPYLNQYMWHIFSYGATPCLQGEAALDELKMQYPTEMFIFNEPQQYLIKCWGKVPLLEIEDFFDDIYVCHHNMKWTYVIPHEIPDLGPYFATG